MGVQAAAVTNWIARRQLTSPALRADGRINFGRARAQIRGSVDQIASAAAMRAVRSSRDQAPVEEPTHSRAVDQLMRAKALSAAVDAARKRRDFLAENGKYVVASEAEQAWARSFGRVLRTVEESFPDLCIDLDLGPSEELVLHRWWQKIVTGSSG